MEQLLNVATGNMQEGRFVWLGVRKVGGSIILKMVAGCSCHYTVHTCILIIIIIIIIIFISFMQGIYTYIPKTNCVPREYSVAAILLLLFMVLISLVSVLNLLYFYISTFRSMCAVPQYGCFL